MRRSNEHFKFADAGMNQGSEVAGVVGGSNTNFSGN
jgi:hypothetical protein